MSIVCVSHAVQKHILECMRTTPPMTKCHVCYLRFRDGPPNHEDQGCAASESLLTINTFDIAALLHKQNPLKRISKATSTGEHTAMK